MAITFATMSIVADKCRHTHLVGPTRDLVSFVVHRQPAVAAARQDDQHGRGFGRFNVIDDGFRDVLGFLAQCPGRTCRPKSNVCGSIAGDGTVARRAIANASSVCTLINNARRGLARGLRLPVEIRATENHTLRAANFTFGV